MLWNIPLSDAVILFEQSLIQRLHRLRVGKIDRRIAVGIGPHKAGQRRMCLHQHNKIIARAMQVTRMQGRGGVVRLHEVRAERMWDSVADQALFHTR